MEDHTASSTSLGVAGLRAAHQLIDGPPALFTDPVILQLLGPDRVARIKGNPGVFRKPALRYLRSHVVLRSRYAEDRLKEAYAGGIRQYILLGAGLDTFAWRQPPGMEDLRIFEVDHPATQAQKRSDLAGAGIPMPENIRWVPVNFESASLKEELDRHGFDWTKPCFISWLGVMVYLSMEAIDSILGLVVSLAPTSRIVFTFTQQRGYEGPDSIAARAAAGGEPWRTFFSPEELTDKLRGLGFSGISILDPEEARRQYYSDRTDDLPPPDRASICLAIV